MQKVKWVLALDVGQKKTGVAVGQTLTQTAKPLGILKIPVQKLHVRSLSNWIDQWSVSAIVFGLPVLRDGKPHPLRDEILRLGEDCKAEFALPVYFVDEYLTSHEAKSRLGKNAGKGSGKKRDLDALAASIIAEDWLSSNGNQ